MPVYTRVSKGHVNKTLGYREVYADGIKTLEHRAVMEQHLGRKLNPGEIVHHINHVKLDNRIENLEIVNGQSEHARQHCKGRDMKELSMKGHAARWGYASSI